MLDKEIKSVYNESTMKGFMRQKEYYQTYAYAYYYGDTTI